MIYLIVINLLILQFEPVVNINWNLSQKSAIIVIKKATTSKHALEIDIKS